MSIDQRRRLQLYEVARERLGSEAADTLMELLPPMDPSELATKQDLAALTTATKQDLAVVSAELRAEVHEQFREQTNRLLMFILPTMLSTVGLAFAATHI